ncbi:SHOCT domain-containing protein [uncultured Jannaschia sp.]|uniref:SHOCT domain-containing protein n=1 Tax=uncultured Jannaschia sp. TaxID=293347 RepID=UPI002614B1AE|nr:SHOCT domain-containing protein [uncultured Jannaschia sp.]
MSQPATELTKLLSLRDAGELTEAEFARAKERVLNPLPEPGNRPRRGPLSWILGDVAASLIAVIVAVALLIGSVVALALTEIGFLALTAIVVVGLLVLCAVQFLSSW